MADENAKETFPTIFVMFGATGDLAQRKLIPAFWQLYKSGRLSPLFQIVGIAKSALSDTEYQAWVREQVPFDPAQGAQEKDKIEAFCKLFVYQAGQFEDGATYAKVAERLGRQDDTWKLCANKLFYLAVPPQFYQTIFQHLADSGLTVPCSEEEGWTRVCVEKPFGRDLETAQNLDALLAKLFREEQIYRIDHYLGKETARNILAFRFSNTFLEPAWDSRSVAAIHIHFPEASGVEGRGETYDGVGALRDVGQNHMLQLLALFMMENPGSYDAEAIREGRTRVLEALEILDNQDVAKQTMRGQYTGYQDADGVAADSETETYFRIQTNVNLPQWQGVPVYLESGKGLSESKFEIIVQFRHQTPCLCPAGQHYTNELRYRLQPDEGVFMNFWVKKPGTDMVIEEKEFSFDYHQAYGQGEFIDAYVKLLLDAIAGDQTLFVSTGEIVASWRFIDPIVRAWKNIDAPLVAYDAGTPRAQMADRILKAQEPVKRIGYVGLGKMGSNMVERLVDHGWEVVATDPDEGAQAAVEEYGARTVANAVEVVQTLRPIRQAQGKRAQGESNKGVLVWLMVPHQAVDEVLQEIVPHLEEGDAVIDGGNSHYKESVRRAQELSEHGIQYLDVGVSGGPGGARDGACLMIGGPRAAYKQYVGLFGDLSVAAGFDYMGESGAGHFVKMVHNGIEYGMMQAIGEGFEIMKSAEHDLDLERIAHLYNHGSVIESSLVGWLKDAYEKFGPELDDISGSVAHSGEGQWTVEAARELGIPVPIIEGALQFRVDSTDAPRYTGQVVSALRNMFGGHEVKKKVSGMDT